MARFPDGVQRGDEHGPAKKDAGHGNDTEFFGGGALLQPGDPDSKKDCCKEEAESVQEGHVAGRKHNLAVPVTRDRRRCPGGNLESGKEYPQAGSSTMKRLVRKMILPVVVVAFLAMGAVVCLSILARKHVTVESLILMAEGELNSRVHVGQAELSLFKFPATLTLKDVALSERDSETSKPPSERTPLKPEGAPVHVREISLSVSLVALLRKRVQVREFVFHDPRLAITLYEEGGMSLDKLLRKPGPAGDGAELPGPGRTGGGLREMGGKLNAKSLNVYAQGFLGEMREVRFEDASIDFIIEKTGMVVEARRVNMRFDRMEIDPSALEETNTARAEIEAEVRIDAVESPGVRYAEFDFEGPAEASLFDPESGDLDLDIRGGFELGEGSYINARIPLVQRGWAAMQKLRGLGIKIGDLPEKALPGRSRTVAVHYHDQRFTVEEPISIWYNDWEVAVLEGTSVHSGTAEHRARVEVIASEQLSNKFYGQIGRGVDIVPKALRPILMDEVEETWFRDGRLLAEITTEGELSRPSIDLQNKFPDLKEIVRKAGKKILGDQVGDAIKGLLGD